MRMIGRIVVGDPVRRQTLPGHAAAFELAALDRDEAFRRSGIAGHRVDIDVEQPAQDPLLGVGRGAGIGAPHVDLRQLPQVCDRSRDRVPDVADREILLTLPIHWNLRKSIGTLPGVSSELVIWV